MRFLSFAAAGKETFGAVVDERIVDLGQVMPQYRTLRDVLVAGALMRAQDIAIDTSTAYEFKQVEFLPPITDARKIVCIGINYTDRTGPDGAAETPQGASHPSVHLRTQESLVGHGAPLWRPGVSEQLDYEGEIVLVIGKAGRHIPAATALSHIAGYSLMNEGSVRDWMRHSATSNIPGKNFERSGAFGPWLVSADEFAGHASFELITRVNGEERQRDSTDHLRFDFAYLISYLSTFMPLQPGDLIATGTPKGAGAGMTPPVFLQAGDVVEVEAPGLGILCNEVEDEPPEASSR